MMPLICCVMGQAMRDLEAVGFHEHGIGEDFSNWAIGHKPSLVEQQDSRARFTNHLQVMRRDYFRDLQSVDQLNELAPSARVQMARRFIQEKDLRPHRQYARKGDSPLFARGKMKRHARFETLQADSLECPGDSVPDFFARQLQIQWPECDVVKDGRAEDLVVTILEDNSNPGGKTRSLTGHCWIEPGQIDCVRLHSQNACQTQEKRRLTCPIGTNDSHTLTSFNLE
jgi:hypothetical protein